MARGLDLILKSDTELEKCGRIKMLSILKYYWESSAFCKENPNKGEHSCGHLPLLLPVALGREHNGENMCPGGPRATRLGPAPFSLRNLGVEKNAIFLFFN